MRKKVAPTPTCRGTEAPRKVIDIEPALGHELGPNGGAFNPAQRDAALLIDISSHQYRAHRADARYLLNLNP